jgi:hypothetical protein
VIEYNESESQFVGLDELFAHAQEIVLLVGGFLDDVEEGVLHDDLGSLEELLIQQHVLVVGVVALGPALPLIMDLHMD